jgi:hypothetical protein
VIIIYYKDNSYKIGFFEKKKCYIECTPGAGSLSQEEIDMLLRPVDYEDE